MNELDKITLIKKLTEHQIKEYGNGHERLRHYLEEKTHGLRIALQIFEDD